jgi:hypothetical protein
MDYKGFLELVKQQNPDMPGKEQQKLASEKYREFKDNLKSQANSNPPPSEKSSAPLDVKEDITFSELVQAEKRIRAKGVDINSVISIGLEVIPEGKIVKHGKEGVNTRVSFEDNEGNKIPVNGHFYIYI